MIGIYKITNKINNLVYIGQSIDVEKRLRAHKTISKNIEDDHFSEGLYEDMNIYRVENFTYECIEECSTQQELDLRESY